MSGPASARPGPARRSSTPSASPASFRTSANRISPSTWWERSRSGRIATLLALGSLAVGPAARPATAQSLLERTPNLNGPAVPPARSARFVFLHRFELVGEETEKLLNYPTLTLGVGLPRAFGIGATYTSNSEIGAGTPNEWEVWLKKRHSLDERLDIAGTGAWNSAAESADGEVAARLRIGPLALHGVVRGFSSAFDTGEAAAAFGGGVMIHLTPRLAVGGDVADIVTDLDAVDTPTAWSAGVHAAVPGSPHTVGFVVSNVGATTLQSASLGSEEADGDDAIRYGFAFTLPLGTFGQWARIFHGAKERSGNVVEIRDFAFGPREIRVQPGETVRWVNDDETAHSVTADDDAFDSGLLEPGEGYSRRFDEPGHHPYHCAPHPYMTAIVVVEEG